MIMMADDDCTGEVEEEEDCLAERQRLKAALHYSVGTVCGEVEGVEFSREAVAAMTEAAFNQTRLLATDLEAFAKHAKRTVVGPEDVRLCCRRNDDLLTHMSELVERLRRERETRKAPVAQGNTEGEEEAKTRTKRPSKKRKLITDEDN